MFRTTIRILTYDEGYPTAVTADVMIQGRKVFWDENDGMPAAEALRGKLCSLVYNGEPQTILLYSTTKETFKNSMRFVRVADLHIKSDDDMSFWQNALSEPVDNIKTVLEFLSL